MHQSILTYISNYITLNEEEEQFFISILKHRVFRKRQYIVQSGDVCKFETFVIKGCLRAYFVDPSGHEHILQFAIENWWISDFASLATGETAQLNVDALEDSEVFQIEKEKMDELFIKYPKFNYIFRLMLQNAYIAHQQRILDNLSKPAKERYLTFVNKYRNIEQKVPQHQIASYLGITPEFLSQIRKQISQSDSNS